MKVSFERKACKARLLSGTVNELMCVRDEGECRLSGSILLSRQAAKGGMRKVGSGLVNCLARILRKDYVVHGVFGTTHGLRDGSPNSVVTS